MSRTCPEAGGCAVCPDRATCRMLRITLAVTTEDQEIRVEVEDLIDSVSDE